MDLKKLIGQMTVEEKIGQLTQYNINLLIDSDAKITGPEAERRASASYAARIGSVLNFTCFDEVKTAQEIHLDADRNKIPMLFMMDVIHGYRTIFPIPLALGCSFDPKLVTSLSQMASREAAADGVHVTFTPMVDYVRDARWGRVMETCGEEPMLNSIMGAAQVEGFQGDDLSDPENLATCVKHFAAYGGAEAGRDYNTVEISERLLREAYLPAYKACLDAGAVMIMPSFNSLNGIPAVANQWLMDDVLRKEWGFEGVVVSDFNAIGELIQHGIAADYNEAAQLSFGCGCHIDMCSDAYIRCLKNLIEEGIFSEEQLDEAVLKVLELKDRLGLFEDPYHGASAEKFQQMISDPAHRALARRGAAESSVLLKNTGILPFSDQVNKVALIGPFAQEDRVIGFWHCAGRYEDSVTVEQGIRNALPDAQITVVAGCGNQWDDTDTSGIEAAVTAAKEADIVILCLGEPEDYSGEGNSRTDLDLPGVQNNLAERVAAVNPNTVAVIFNGRPLTIQRLDQTVPAILDVWFPGTECGNAVADLLFGKVNPCGKLSMTFPKNVGQCPIYYNHPSTGRPKPENWENKHIPYLSNYIDCGNLPLYSFGYGLSYSHFVYESMELNADELTVDGQITVTITVKNDSDVAGKETVQLYLRDMVASAVRPVQQMIDFRKVSFEAHEIKKISFVVTEPMLRFWNFKNEFMSEPGEFEISTGFADHLIHTKRFWLR